MELLDRADDLSVSAQNWERLAMVYQVLEGRLTENADKIELLIRYASVLREKGEQPSQAFDVVLKAFELDPHRDDLLELVEQSAETSCRWKDLARVYNVCARISEDQERKVDLKIREVACLRDKIENEESAMAAVFETLCIDPLDDRVASRVWGEVEISEKSLDEETKGAHWKKLIDLYRTFLKKYSKDAGKKAAVLLTVAKIYKEKLSDKANAFESIKEAQQGNPKDEMLVDKLETMARENDFWEELIAHYADILDETFEMEVAALIHRRRGRVLEEELNRSEDAAEHYWQIIQLDPSDLSSYDKLITHYEKVEKWNELVNLLERQLDNTHDQDAKKRLLFRIASIWEKCIGNLFEAKDWYEQILMIWSDETDAKAGLERIVKGSRIPDDVIEEEATATDGMEADEEIALVEDEGSVTTDAEATESEIATEETEAKD
jgi:tetratricopeptide (TPR) repeat protein